MLLSGREMGAEVDWPLSTSECVMVHGGLGLLNGLRGQGQEALAGGRSEQAAFDEVELSGAGANSSSLERGSRLH